MKIFVFSWSFDYKEDQDTKKVQDVLNSLNTHEVVELSNNHAHLINSYGNSFGYEEIKKVAKELKIVFTYVSFNYKVSQAKKVQELSKKLKAFKFYIDDIVDDTYMCCIDSEEGDNEEFIKFIEALEKI